MRCSQQNSPRANVGHQRPSLPVLNAINSHSHTDGATVAETQVQAKPTANSRTRRRVLLLAGTAALVYPRCAPKAKAEIYGSGVTDDPATTITNLVYLDIGIAPRSFKTAGERTLGDRTVVPLDDAVPVGRIILGLYGQSAPGTVANFLRLVRSGALKDTTFSRVLPGEYIQAGQQGAFRLGQVQAEGADLQSNPDLSSPSAFRLRHLRPGTLSLSLAENDEDPQLKLQPGYRNTEFLITTGPGPVPRLDSGNLVFGRVVEGMSVIGTIAQVPTFKPSERSKQLNVFAQTIGDDRAATVRRKYGKPLKAVIIQDLGELPLPLTTQQTPAAAAAILQ